jgi:hypothetical protein
VPVLQIRITEEKEKWYKELAERGGKRVSEWARECLDREVDKAERRTQAPVVGEPEEILGEEVEGPVIEAINDAVVDKKHLLETLGVPVGYRRPIYKKK